MPRKPKLPQAEVSNGCDMFRTPNYATELLIPFIPKGVGVIWDCASGAPGDMKIIEVLFRHGYGVAQSDIQQGEEFDFLKSDKINVQSAYDCIVTNPPYSLKRKFYEKCMEIGLPWALLIPFDMAGWLHKAFKDDGCQGIVPSRRINYITPTGLSEASGHTSYYHSFWLTHGFNLQSQFEWVELKKEDQKDI